MGSLRAVLFDLDGTLLFSRLDFPGMKNAVLALAAEFGVGRASLEGLDILGAADQAARELASLQADQFRAQARQALEAFERAAAGEASPMPGATDTLEGLRWRGIAIGIVTRNSRSAVELSLSRVPLPHDLLLTRDDVPLPKPHPDHLLRALAALRVPAHQALMVGDHRMDILAGQAAGLRTAAAMSRQDWLARFPETAADHYLSPLTELLLLA